MISIFKSIWFNPKQTLLNVIDNRNDINNYYSKVFFFIITIAGTFSLLQTAKERLYGDFYDWEYILLLSVCLGPIAALLGLNFETFLLHKTGKWLGGQARFSDVRVSVLLVWIPITVSGLLTIAFILFAGQDYFSVWTPRFDRYSSLQICFYLIIGIQIISAIWSFIVMVACLSELQGFTLLKAVINIILAIVFFILIYILLLVLVVFILYFYHKIKY